MWRLTLYFEMNKFEDENIEVKEYKTYRGAVQAGRYYYRHRPDFKEYEVSEIVD